MTEYYFQGNDDDPRDEMLRAFIRAIANIFAFMLIIVLIALLTGCKTRTVVVETVRTDTTYITKHQRDSIWLHDSVHVIEKQIGDTVYLLHDRWHTKYVESIKHDTLYQSRVDSVGVPYPVEVYIDKPLNNWRQIRLLFGDIFIIIIGVLGIIAIIKLKTKIWP